MIDVRKVPDEFHLDLLLGITGAIALWRLAIFVLSLTASKYGCPDETRISPPSSGE